MVKVVVPNKAYDGVIAGVTFHNGVGMFDDVEVARRIAKEFGFEVLEEGSDTQEDKKPPRKKKGGE